MSSKPTIAVVTCLWQRPALTSLVLAWYQAAAIKLRDKVTLKLVAVGSEGAASKNLAQKHGWLYLEHPNKFLSDKWNIGVRFAKTLKPDAVLILGSDDVMSIPLLEHYVGLVNKVSYAGLLDIYFLDASSFKAVHFLGYIDKHRKGETVGAGRLLSSKLLDQLNWAPWAPKTRRSLDASMTEKIKKLKVKCHAFRMNQVKGGALIDIKTGTNIGTFKAVSTANKKSVSKSVKGLRILVPFKTSFVLGLKRLPKPKRRSKLSLPKQYLRWNIRRSK